MTEQEAMEVIMQVSYDGEFPMNSNEAFEIACNALEKQIPKKIIKLEHNKYSSPYICPVCEADQTPTEFFTLEGGEPEEKHTYCWNCGQKLDWSVEE